jgi:hypothetical protein
LVSFWQLDLKSDHNPELFFYGVFFIIKSISPGLVGLAGRETGKAAFND